MRRLTVCRIGGMIMPIVIMVIWMYVAPHASADSAAADGSGEVVAALDESASAWSKGDLAGFMRCYENSPQTTYLKSDGMVRGYDAIRTMYASRFGNTPGSMGVLSLKMMEFRPLGAAYALVTGRYMLARHAQGQKDASGVFTLVFHKSGAGWGIISDHTS